MHVERLDIAGFRNCCDSVSFDPALTLLLGENNAGKTNIVDALRLALISETGTDRLRPQLSDFARGADGGRVSEEFAITAVLAGLSVKEQGHLSLALAPKSEGYGKARIGVRATVGPDGDVSWFRFGGDHDSPDVEQRALNAVHHTYLPPLRDAGSDLQPGRSNRLARLLYAVTPQQEDRDRLVKLADDANKELAKDKKVRRAVELVQGVLDEMTLEKHRQQSDIAFADAEFAALVRQLLARLGETRARDLAESGLGYQNLLYMAVLLAHLGETDATRVPLRVLLVEEPEAHLHPQLQDLLLRFLQEPDQKATTRQVIVTSNSPQFAAAAELNRLVVVTRARGAAKAAAHAVRDVEMTDAERAHVRRFLDVTKAALFFARGVILVEGVSEQLLLPHLARLAGRNLADSGVTVINVGGVAFSHFARLFGDGALPIPCSIISDGDADPTVPDVDNPSLEQNQRGKNLRGLRGGNVDVFLADVTLEWDLARAQPRDPLLTDTMTLVHPLSGPRVAAMTQLSATAWATEFRSKLTEKAVFAQELAAALDADLKKTLVVPDYLKRAIEHATTPATPPPDDEAKPSDGRS
jgi:putative ATP-dependent endonuclease of the OLD family